MSLSSWLRKRTATRNPKPRADRPASFRPQLEGLEGRDVPSTLTVTNTLDSGHGSLRYEIAQAEKNSATDTIVFNISKKDPGYNAGTGRWTITLTGGELDITQNLTIQGPGAGLLTISGGHSSRVFEVARNGTAAVSGLTITGGNSGFASTDYLAEGGDVLNLGALTLSGCTVSDGTTLSGDLFGHGGPGGDIANLGGTLTVNACAISGGYAAQGVGGGIYNGYGGTVNVSGGTVSGNNASEGGGIFNDSGCTLMISGCTISDSAGDVADGGAGYGGGIYNAGTATVSGCTLTGNYAPYGSGGAIYNAGAAAALTVSNSHFSGNAPDDIYGPYVDGGGNTFG